METEIINSIYNKFSKIIESRKLFDGIDKFLLLFSCGKDCSVLLDMMLRYIEEEKITAELSIYSVQYPKHMYYNEEQIYTKNFSEIMQYWKNRGVSIHYVLPPFDDFPDNDKMGCKICKKTRKWVIDDYVNNLPGSVGILTGFTMYDSLAYLAMMQLTCNFDLNNISQMKESERKLTTRTLHKMSLREYLPNGKYIIRPLLIFTEKDVINYIDAARIPHLNTPCKIIDYKFKRVYSKALDLYEKIPVTYEGIERFLSRSGIKLNNGGLSFEDVSDCNFFIDC